MAAAWRGAPGLCGDPTDPVGGWLLTWFPFKEEHVLPLEGGHPAGGDAVQGWAPPPGPTCHVPPGVPPGLPPVPSARQGGPSSRHGARGRVQLCTTDLGRPRRQRCQGRGEPWSVLLEMPALWRRRDVCGGFTPVPSPRATVSRTALRCRDGAGARARVPGAAPRRRLEQVPLRRRGPRTGRVSPGGRGTSSRSEV